MSKLSIVLPQTNKRISSRIHEHFKPCKNRIFCFFLLILLETEKHLSARSTIFHACHRKKNILRVE